MFRYSDKQLHIYKQHIINPHWQFLINHGSIRSGKTTLDNDIFLQELRQAKLQADKDGNTPLYILAAETQSSLWRNVLTDLESRYRMPIKLDEKNTFPLLGCRVCCFGHSKADSYKSLVGMTAYGGYLNEMTLAHPSFTDEVVKRCSGRLKVVGDTNPDHPEHYIKTDYVDKADGQRILEYSWKLEDNPFLTDEYVAGVKAITPSGMFYDRKILGLWTTADGLVYKDFDKTKVYIESLPTDIVKYWAAVDWGYEHKGVIQLWGRTSTGDIVMINEIARQHEEIDYWVAQAHEINRNLNRNIPFFCDDARPEHIARFKNEGIRAYQAKKSIISGIEEVAKLIKAGKLKVYRPNADNFNQEIYKYVWDKKSGHPIKKDDDSMDTMRYAIYTEKLMPHVR